MVHLKTFALIMFCLPLLFLVDFADGQCVNDTEICGNAGENQCNINGVIYCCAGEKRVIRAVYSDTWDILACECESPSPSNIGHRCTQRTVSSAFGTHRTSASLATCALVLAVMFLALR